MKKLRVGILFGGKSAEHEVSIMSAANVLAALDTTKYEPVLIGIDKAGGWHIQPVLPSGHVELQSGNEVTLRQTELYTSAGSIGNIDVVFPVLHGPMGEDGTVQGLLKLAGVPFVGSDVLGSAIGMDKDVMKRLLRDAGIPIAQFICIRRGSIHPTYNEIMSSLRVPFFVKPANMGSSVGVRKVTSSEEFESALEEAFRFDTKILVEQAIIGDEIECAVLGNDTPKASLPGQVIPTHDFYDYEAKYIDEHGAVLEVPAQMSESDSKKVQEIAIRTFKVLECTGMARVDMFHTPDGDLIINEVNTIPGFTKISMYPKLWEASGISYTELISNLIDLAQERHSILEKLSTSY